MVALALLLAVVATPRSADDPGEMTKGAALYRVCQAEVRLMDMPTLTKATQSDLLNGSYCVGYLNGFVSNLQPATTVCTNGIAIGELVRIYVAFMERNPVLMDKDRRLGLHHALHEALPCAVETFPGTGAPSPSQTVL